MDAGSGQNDTNPVWIFDPVAHCVVCGIVSSGPNAM